MAKCLSILLCALLTALEPAAALANTLSATAPVQPLQPLSGTVGIGMLNGASLLPQSMLLKGPSITLGTTLPAPRAVAPIAAPRAAALPVLKAVSGALEEVQKSPSKQGAAQAPLSQAFDGTSKPAGAAPVSIAAAAGPAPSGLQPVLPGLQERLDVRSYRTPPRISRTRRVYLAAHVTLLGAAAAAAAASVGLLPSILAGGLLAVLLCREALLSRDDGVYAFNTSLYGAAARAYRETTGRILESLTARLGLAPDRTPGLVIDNRAGQFGASSRGTGVNADSRVTLGEGFARKPAEYSATVMAHELGHLVLGDHGWPQQLRTREGARSGMGALLKFAALAGTFLLASAWGDPLGAARSGLLLLSSLPLATLGFMSGLAAARQEEFRADDFAGWLTDPSWLAAHLREREVMEAPVRVESPYWRLFSTHPPNQERINRLTPGTRPGAS